MLKSDLDDQGYATVTLDRPILHNAFDEIIIAELTALFSDLSVNSDVRLIVLAANGNSFCAGADLKTYTMPFATTPAPEFTRVYTNGPGLGGITRNVHVFKPIVAAVNGYAISGGLEIALACDIRFCSPSAAFGLQDVRWGFHACDGALIRLRQIIGLGHAMEMILSGDRFDAEFAARTGLVNRVIEQSELLVNPGLC